ncbi:transaldolase [uncultured Dietzia sp.]|uniref:transaldolase n=1 Tax=uncultured Dietzia sp. TaxID=395519 RepID=UPI0025DA48D6|nr:transaldolase [uncultured Dietzia sp.]
MNQNQNLSALSEAGVSVWLDDLSRDLISSGELAELVATRSVVGVTTNPSIFQAALSSGTAYDTQVAALAAEGADVDTVIRTTTTDDVRAACDVLEPVFAVSDEVDGRVSIEVDPRLAHDADATVAQAIELWRIVDRPNLLIKIPATVAGLEAIRRVIAEGISVNVTLIFSVDRYVQVMLSYLEGLSAAAEAGRDLGSIHSVASFFVSRVDTEIDARLEELGTGEARDLQGKAALANARLAYAEYSEVFSAGARFAELAGRGARPQRPLWASTGVKNPEYDDTLYVSGLIAPGTVNTMPASTMKAFADHGRVEKDPVVGRAEQSAETFRSLERVGVDLVEVFDKLEAEGVAKFESAWTGLLQTTAQQIRANAEN